MIVSTKLKCITALHEVLLLGKPENPMETEMSKQVISHLNSGEDRVRRRIDGQQTRSVFNTNHNVDLFKSPTQTCTVKAESLTSLYEFIYYCLLLTLSIKNNSLTV